MRRLATLAAVAGLAGSAFLAAAPAQATCYVNVSRPTGLGVCASIKPDPTYGTCVHVAVYTDAPAGDQDPLFCV